MGGVPFVKLVRQVQRKKEKESSTYSNTRICRCMMTQYADACYKRSKFSNQRLQLPRGGTLTKIG